MKKLLTHKLLVLPTGGSFVWTQAIIEKRKKQGLKTLEVDFTEHFWLNPFAYCDSLKDLSKKLEKNFSSVQCLEKAKELKARMQRLIKNKSLILQHSGLDSFLKILGQSYFVLSSGHHHSEMSAHKVKKLLKYLGSRPKIIWVKEQGLEDQYLIDKFKRPEDIIINYHPFRFEKGRSPLESFLEELAKAEQKR